MTVKMRRRFGKTGLGLGFAFRRHAPSMPGTAGFAIATRRRMTSYL
jgi:hypothetical protein